MIPMNWVKMVCNEVKVIYFDLDGVLVDLYTKYFEIYKNIDFNQIDFNEAVYKHKIFEIAKPTEEFHTIMSCIDLSKKDIRYAILSSSAHSSKSPDRSIFIRNQKLNWVNKYCKPYGLVDMHLVRNKKYKKEYATSNSFLIDDTSSNVSDFNLAGGKAILHTKNSTQETINFITRARGD